LLWPSLSVRLHDREKTYAAKPSEAGEGATWRLTRCSRGARIVTVGASRLLVICFLVVPFVVGFYTIILILILIIIIIIIIIVIIVIIIITITIVLLSFATVDKRWARDTNNSDTNNTVHGAQRTTAVCVFPFKL
jgi:uncharacterized membrane protein YhaH (DUF805 family)